MNKKHEKSDDILRDYINPELIERAPVGFTSRVMAEANSELLPVTKQGLLSQRSLVPVIYVLVVLVFLMAIFLLPGTKETPLLTSAMQSLKNIRILIPKFDLSSILSYNLPVTLSYVFIGIIILSLLDRALNVVFKREE